MGKKYKMTGCARLFLILIIVTPLAYFGASYFNGEDGLAKIKSLFQSDERPAQRNTADVADLEQQLNRLEKDVKFYETEVTRLKQELADCQNSRN